MLLAHAHIINATPTWITWSLKILWLRPWALIVRTCTYTIESHKWPSNFIAKNFPHPPLPNPNRTSFHCLFDIIPKPCMLAFGHWLAGKLYILLKKYYYVCGGIGGHLVYWFCGQPNSLHYPFWFTYKWFNKFLWSVQLLCVCLGICMYMYMTVCIPVFQIYKLNSCMGACKCVQYSTVMFHTEEELSLHRDLWNVTYNVSLSPSLSLSLSLSLPPLPLHSSALPSQMLPTVLWSTREGISASSSQGKVELERLVSPITACIPSNLIRILG